jgi:hypothetical protein
MARQRGGRVGGMSGGGAMPQAVRSSSAPIGPTEPYGRRSAPSLPGFSAAGMAIYFRTSQTVW